jgi:putative heme-binding domain-containing protein
VQYLHEASLFGDVLGVVLGTGDLLPQVLIQSNGKWFPVETIGPAVKSASESELKAILAKVLEHQAVEEFLVFSAAGERRGLSAQLLISETPGLRANWEQLEELCLQRIRTKIRINWKIAEPEDSFIGLAGAHTDLIEALRYMKEDLSVPVLREVLSSDPPSDILRSSLEVISALPDPGGVELLLDNFEKRAPAARSTIISALLTSEPRITKLLDLVESNQVSFLEIGQTRLASLQQVKNPEIQARLQKLVAANAPADRSKVLEEYQAALAHEHDPLRGRELFAKNCAICHKIGDLGVEVAPNISDSRVKTHAQLLTDILDPNRAIDNNYFSYTLVNKAGTVATGIISAETSSSVTLKQPEGKTLTVLRSDIEQLKPNGVSLMPVGFEKQLTVAQMADVISFIKNWRYLDGQVPKEVIK